MTDAEKVYVEKLTAEQVVHLVFLRCQARIDDLNARLLNVEIAVSGISDSMVIDGAEAIKAVDVINAHLKSVKDMLKELNEGVKDAK